MSAPFIPNTTHSSRTIKQQRVQTLLQTETSFLLYEESGRLMMTDSVFLFTAVWFDTSGFIQTTTLLVLTGHNILV